MMDKANSSKDKTAVESAKADMFTQQIDILGTHGRLAHDPTNDPTACSIVIGQAMTFERRETSRLDFLEPSVELLLDLDVGIRDLADRARSKGEHIDPLTCRIPHEIAPQGSPVERFAQFVVGKGEMIHSNRAIAGIEKSPNR